MKTFITLLLLTLFVSVNAFSQAAERKYEHATVFYNIQGKGSITIYYGKDRREIINQTKNIKTKGYFEDDGNYVMDALNYMDEQGYELVSSHGIVNVALNGVQYVFRRELKK
jgi:hypothetical protein